MNKNRFRRKLLILSTTFFSSKYDNSMGMKKLSLHRLNNFSFVAEKLFNLMKMEMNAENETPNSSYRVRVK